MTSTTLPKQLQIAAFTGSPTISSRRFRVLQYKADLEQLGIQVDEFISRFGSWPPQSNWKRPFWLAATLADRLPAIALSHRYDLTLFQRELVSTMFTLERFSKRPRFLDVDDAVWLNGRRSAIHFPSLVKSCDRILCGNIYICENVSKWNRNVRLLPTAVDTTRFHPKRSDSANRLIIGWSGLNAGAKYLLNIEDALYQLLSRRRDAVLRVVSDARPSFTKLEDSMVEFVRWSPKNEVQTIQEMSVGLMPIDDTPWSRGKCSYKMLLYMACGIPVVVSPYGMNDEVLSKGRAGLSAKSHSEWIDSIDWLLDSPGDRLSMGITGRNIVETEYSLNVLAPRMASYLRD